MDMFNQMYVDKFIDSLKWFVENGDVGGNKVLNVDLKIGDGIRKFEIREVLH
jgi:hypothetical protein